MKFIFLDELNYISLLFSCKMVFIMNQPGLFSPIAIHIHIQ
jgi:hypothetical protein